MKRDTKTEVDTAGLRYTSKVSGTQFPGAWGRSMSCFRCGKHVARSSLESFHLAGSVRWRCREGC
ncbi:hypothetical protein JI739_05095 [Ramlibacter sp. AW1]|uniref:Uncharacterized protein n=1 Tax=Ramlibacter aurantiacus TaxID=2801330 RepID=A0A937D6E0_9BURK|nr:hypothetical protein [Ramlibacter aurantiacus]MBL0419721.1 hypothetical protein [Ramlibacter aurantiacus]